MTDSTDKPRGLWNLMSQRPGEHEPNDEEVLEESVESPAAESESEPADTEAVPKGLWSVMNRPAEVIDREVDEQPSNSDAVEAPGDTADQPSPKGLWGVMSSTPQSAMPDATDEDASETQTNSDSGTKDIAETPQMVHAPSPDEPPGFDLQVSAAEKPAYQRLAVRSGRSKKALVACLAGLFAIPLAGLALRPEPWLRLPATAVGFVALMFGLLGWQDVRASRGRQTGTELALAGIVLGVLAMFLGPIVFARVGQGYRKSSGRQQAITNLEAIGTGLTAYHAERNQFPAGGIFRADKKGSQQPMHGWMTMLLPYIGEEELYESVQFNSPYDAPTNRPAMRQTVNAYLAAGQPTDTISRHKFAPAHFAGLGGELDIEGVGLVQVGVFGRNSNTTREDITDGLSQTFVAGEISAFFPAWGEPENWRTIGRGLNRNASGFGNAAGNGALFLKADGSVKFYTNETDPTLLRQLSTRNAGDIVAQ